MTALLLPLSTMPFSCKKTALAMTVLPLALVALSSLTAAPTAQVILDASARRFVGQPFDFFIVAENSGAIPDPELPVTPDFMLRVGDGLVSEDEGLRTYTLTGQAIPLRAGEANFPSFNLSSGGLLLATPTHRLKIEEPSESGTMKLEVHLSQDRCYVGEPVTLTFAWTSQSSLHGIRALRVKVPALTDPSLRHHPPLRDIDPASQHAIGVPVNGQRLIARVHSKSDSEGGRITFQKLLIPSRAGSIDLPPATLICAVTPTREKRFKGSRYPSYFNNDFFDEDLPEAYEKVFCRSQSLRLEVLALPAEGRPENFDAIGSVGAFQLTATAKPRVLEAEQPLTLSLRASGHPFPQTLKIPGAERISSVGLLFHLPESSARTRLEGSELISTHTLRPMREGVKEIPVLRIPYFDPGSKSYGVAEAGPISIEVAPGRKANASEAEFGDGSRLQTSVLSTESGISANYEGPLVLQASPSHHRPLSSQPLWWLLLTAPPLALGASLFSYRRATRIADDPDGFRARRAYLEFRRSRAAGTCPGDAARSYLADRNRRRRDAHTLTELAGLASHQGAPETAVKTLYQAGANELTATYRDSEEPPLPAARIDEAINAIESANPSTRL